MKNKNDSLGELYRLLRPQAEVFCVLRAVSECGTSCKISFFATASYEFSGMRFDLLNISEHIAAVLGDELDYTCGAVKIYGEADCYDGDAVDVVRELSKALYGSASNCTLAARWL